MFSDAFLMLVVVNVLFLHRPVYKMQKEKIDKAMATFSSMFDKYTKLIVEKIPKYTEAKKN